jgi:serine/threonine protein kinase
MHSASRILDDRYALGGEPREGGTALVYRGTDLQGGHRAVAVKIPKLNDGRIANKMFERECKSLERLEHPNVVRLLDVGRDRETNKRFMVFEWIEDDLASVIKRGDAPQDWDTFVSTLGEPLLSALAAMHEAGNKHRDFKPANILVTPDGTPKLTDFGTAKGDDEIMPGLTVANFRSEPFAVPQENLGFDSDPYRHDVYAWGVTALAVLSRIWPFEKRFDQPRMFVEEALQAIEVPPDAHAFLQSCTAIEPDERPRSASVALAELRTLSQRREEEARQPGHGTVPTCYLSISANARQGLIADLGLSSDQEADELFLKDLADGIALLPKTEGGKPASGRFYLLGNELRSHVQIMSGSPRLRVHTIRPESGVFLDRDRARAWTGLLRFSLGEPRDQAGATEELSDLLNGVLDIAAEHRRGRRDQREPELLGTWRHVLQVMNEIERGREAPIDYVDFQARGRTLTFRLKSLQADQELIGQLRVAELMDGSLLTGEISRVASNELQLRIEQGDSQRLPRRGRLKVDTRLGQAALRRQESALDALQKGTVVKPDLERILRDPESAQAPRQTDEPDWVQTRLDEAKRRAVRKALGTDDLLLIEGPPGTGKTTLIAELIAQEIRRNPDARILVSSQTHAALDNVLERLGALSGDSAPRLLRVGRQGDERIAAGVEPLLLGARLSEWRKEAIKSGRKFLREWAKDRDISERGVEIAMRLDELASVIEGIATTSGQLELAEQRLEHLRENRRSGRATSNESIGDAQDGVGYLRDEIDTLNRLRNDLIVRLQELGSENSAAGYEEMGSADLRARGAEMVDRDHPDYDRCSQLIRLLGDWHARFGRGPEFEGAALVRAQVVAGTCVGLASVPGWENIEFDLCVIDEASKANPTELLIPMSRASRWVLVGDHRQLPPHLDEALLDSELLAERELSREALAETLFERLERNLPEECKVLLSEQHRMSPAVGDLISECFYDGKLRSAPRDNPAWLSPVLPTPVVWLSTAQAAKRGEKRSGFGRSNPLEARCIRNLLGSLNLIAAAARETLSVCILAGYREQCEEINRQIAEKLPSWRALEIRCDTVDSFQGREADVAIYSLTRSNVEGRLGFLNERRRLNVALSRGKLGLVIVGDDRFAYAARGDNPFRSVLDYIERSDGASIQPANP